MSKNGNRHGREWLDRDGAFLFGKYKGEIVERVCLDDPGYINWIIDNVEDIVEEDLDMIKTQLAHSRRGRGR